MTREEFIQKYCYEWTERGYEGKPILIEQMKADLDKLPLPPAEGAEEILNKLLGNPGDSINVNSYQIKPLMVDSKAEWWIVHHGVGSGEPLTQWLNEFTTLHAQKIADKMVEDMRKKLFSMRATKESMDKLSEADRLMMYGYHDCINEMLMWTKSRDSHANKAGE